MRAHFTLRLVPRPLEKLSLAEKRIKQVEPRDFSVDRWMRGEGPKFFTVERVSRMKADNEKLRAERSKRKAK